MRWPLLVLLLVLLLACEPGGPTVDDVICTLPPEIVAALYTIPYCPFVKQEIIGSWDDEDFSVDFEIDFCWRQVRVCVESDGYSRRCHWADLSVDVWRE